MLWQQYYMQLTIITSCLVLVLSLLLPFITIKLFNIKHELKYVMFNNINSFFFGCFIALGININFINNKLSLVKIIYSVVGNISPASFCYLLIWFLPRYFQIKTKKIIHNITSSDFFSQVDSDTSHILSMITILTLGTILYLSTLGFLDIDLYRYGFHNNYMIAALTIFTTIMILKNIAIGYIWSISALAFLYKIIPSNNLWDYLLDPVLWLFSITFLVSKLYKIRGVICIKLK